MPISYTPSNENGEPEFEVVFKKTFLQFLFGKAPSRSTFVQYRGVWCHKGSGKSISAWEQVIITEGLEHLRQKALRSEP